MAIHGQRKNPSSLRSKGVRELPAPSKILPPAFKYSGYSYERESRGKPIDKKHPLLKVPGTASAVWDRTIGRWVVYPRGVPVDLVA